MRKRRREEPSEIRKRRREEPREIKEIETVPVHRHEIYYIEKENKKEFKIATTIIKSQLSFLCGSDINRNYIIKNFIPVTDIVFVFKDIIESGRTTRSSYVGFALVSKVYENVETGAGGASSPRTSKTRSSSSSISSSISSSSTRKPKAKIETWHINLICGKGVGSKLLNYIFEIATKAGIRRITLDALPNVINYYRRFDFKNTKAKNCEEDKEVTAAITPLQGYKFSNVREAIENPDYVKFLELLIAKGLVANEKCVGVSNEMERYENVPITSEEGKEGKEGKEFEEGKEGKEEIKTKRVYIAPGCSADGYPMIKCFY